MPRNIVDYGTIVNDRVPSGGLKRYACIARDPQACIKKGLYLLSKMRWAPQLVVKGKSKSFDPKFIGDVQHTHTTRLV